MFLNFSSSCTKVTMSYWVGWLRSVGHAEEKKKRKIQRPFGLRSRRKRDFDWSKVKVSDLHLLWLDVKSVKGRKRRKRWRKLSIFLLLSCLLSLTQLLNTAPSLHTFGTSLLFLHLCPNGRMASLFNSSSFPSFLPFTLFTSSHNKCKPLTLTLWCEPQLLWDPTKRIGIIAQES